MISFGNSKWLFILDILSSKHHPVIGEPISQPRIILLRSCKSITSPIIDLGRSSTSFFPLFAPHIRECLIVIFSRFQKAIKKVRAVQRMRRNRGFAFSQTEDPARQDQARLIRAYDTSKTHSRPSGY